MKFFFHKESKSTKKFFFLVGVVGAVGGGGGGDLQCSISIQFLFLATYNDSYANQDSERLHQYW